MANVTIEVDSSEATALVQKLRGVLSEEEFNKALFRICSKTARKVSPILKKRLPEEYITKPSWISSAVGNMRMGNGPGISCVIPLRGEKAKIGGSIVKASGGARGWEALRYAGHPYDITATIVKGATSTLPHKLPNQGGQPPFRNLAKGKNGKTALNGLTFTRSGKSQLPIVRVSALAVPQMPLNRSEDAVRNDIQEELLLQTKRYLGYIFK